MKKRKKVALVFSSLLVFSLIFILGINSPNKDVTHELSAMGSDYLVPKEFKRTENIKANSEKFGIVESNNGNKMVLHLKFKPIGNDSVNRQEVAGSGVLHVGKTTFPFKVTTGSYAKCAKLNDGKTFFWGSLNGDIKNKKGQNDILALFFAYIPETKQLLVNCTIGSLGDGLSALSFGSNFINDEMKQLFLN